MIEQFTRDELRQIVKELRMTGIKITDYGKTLLINEEAAKLGIEHVSYAYRDSIADIADRATNNFRYTKNGGKRKYGYIPPDIENAYRHIVSEILCLIKNCNNGVGEDE